VPDVSEPAVRVRVVLVQTSAASVPKVVRERVPEAQTFAGIDVIEDAMEVRDAPIEVEAVLVLALTTAAIEVEAVLVLALTAAVPALIAAFNDVDAVCTSERVASDPDVRPAPVKVRVPLVQTSAARVPKPVKVRVPAAQTFVGIDAIDDVMEVRVEPIEVEAVNTCAFVLALTTAARDVVAV